MRATCLRRSARETCQYELGYRSLRTLVLMSFISKSLNVLTPRLHADGESETDKSSERDEVKSGSDRVQHAELLVCLVHSGGRLYFSTLATRLTC